jgi:hypothetical protein
MRIDAAEQKKHEPRAGSGLMLWLGFVLPPLAWAIEMQAMWLTSEWACDTMEFRWNHVIAVTALAVAIIGTTIAWTQGKASATTPRPTTIETPETRDFVSILGSVLGLLFIALIIAQWLPTLTGVPCSK